MSRSLPEYERPPVVETMAGGQFDPIPKLPDPVLAVFADGVSGVAGSGAAPTNPTEQSARRPVFEEFGARRWLWALGEFGARSGRRPRSRYLARLPGSPFTVQVQNGLLLTNWLGHGGGEYPRFSALRDLHRKVGEGFAEFVTGRGYDPPVPNQWELSYVNHLPRGSVWETPADWAGLFRLPAPTAPTDRAALENFSGRWRFQLPEQAGRVHVRIEHESADGDGRDERLAFVLTARGPASSDAEVAEGLERGHAAIVWMFTDLTSEAAHEYWGRTR